jgi:hypothetical protein
LKIPLLPYRNKNSQIIFPLGTWYAIYFSEELKKCQKFGYKFTLIQGWEFSKIKLFDDYVNHFYNVKKMQIMMVKDL